MEPATEFGNMSSIETLRFFASDSFTEVIVERAAEARENDQEAKLKKKQQDRAKSMEDGGKRGGEGHGISWDLHGMSWRNLLE